MRKIDLSSWPRRTHYDFYKNYDMPHFSLTANIDVTKLLQYSKNHQMSFFALMLYHVFKIVMEIDEFRTRIRGEEVVLHDVVHPSFTVLSNTNLVMFVPSVFKENMNEFVKETQDNIEKARSGKELVEEYGRDDTIYITTIPWVSFTDMKHPYDTLHPDSIPRIAWGKYTEQSGVVTMPLSVTVHHALCDGYHVGMYFMKLQESINQFI